MAKLSIIGGGFSGLSAACFLAKQGHEVVVFEKNTSTGGRARSFEEQGFTFDMGPSWYWMPDVFEKFFMNFGKKPTDYYPLIQLDPGFQVIFGKNDVLEIPAALPGIYELFENIEKGSSGKLKKFLEEGEFKYTVGMQQMVYKPSYSWLEFAKFEVLAGAARLHMFQSMSTYVRRFFKDERLIAVMEFPVLFLGAMANQVPALYSLMNYAALSLGTWYPMGGMLQISRAMENLAATMGVKISCGMEVNKIEVRDKHVYGVQTGEGFFQTDGLIASCDYHYAEQFLLEPGNRNYTNSYWDKRTLAPSCLIFYIGVSKKINKLIHHNLFFDTSMEVHAREIYENPGWPEHPLFYACCPSKTDSSVAPPGMENLFLLIPVAPGLTDNEEVRNRYFEILIGRMEHWCEDIIMPYITYKRSYCINDFITDYHSFKGNAYGLANTLRQTAVLKPSMRNKKVKNMFYAGQFTVPGPGVPPALISGQLAAEQLLKFFN